MKITIVGMGYVGMSLAMLLCRQNKIICFDKNEEKLNLISNKLSPVKDKLIQKFLIKKNLNINVSKNSEEAFKSSKYIIICTPTDYDERTNKFNTNSVTSTIKNILLVNRKASIIIKSTIPVGFTIKMRKKYLYDDIYFSPEFLREGRALYDNLYPSRIIIGGNTKNARRFTKLLLESAEKKKSEIPILLMNSNEAESVKLFANTYLAMRIAFFNELDSFSEIQNLDSKKIIEGVSFDTRIGNYYNNPSFGYGGYCLPKDTKQLRANYKNVPNSLISSIVDSNKVRKDFITKMISKKRKKTVGVYRLAMKKDSDNFRSSAITDILIRLRRKGIKTMIFEPLISRKSYLDANVITDLTEFKEKSDIIITNRVDSNLDDVKNKIYTRDIFRRD